jgi:hypothetical protein
MGIIENNKMIAEFMGLELEETLKKEMVYARHELKNPNKLNDCTTEFYYPKELLYHFSWDWIMEVVEEINHKGDEDEGFFYNFVIHPNECYVQYDGETVVSNQHGATFIGLVYYTVLEFIKWYNKQKQ